MRTVRLLATKCLDALASFQRRLEYRMLLEYVGLIQPIWILAKAGMMVGREHPPFDEAGPRGILASRLDLLGLTTSPPYQNLDMADLIRPLCL